MLRDRQAGVGRRVRRDEADLGELVWSVTGLPSSTLIDPRARRQQTDREVEEGRLTRSVRADEPDDSARGDRQRAVLKRPLPAVLLAEAIRFDDAAHATPSAKALRNAVR